MKRFLPNLDPKSVQIALKSCLAMVTLFAHDRVTFIVAMALLIGFAIYRLQVSRYPYAWLVFIITSMLVGFFSAPDFSSTFHWAVYRPSAICLGLVIAFLVHGILWPIRAGKVFERQLNDFLDGFLGMLSLTSRMLAGDEPDMNAVKKADTDQVNAIAALRDLARTRDGTAKPRKSDACTIAGIDQTAPIDTASSAMLAGGLHDLARQVSKVRATIARVEDPEQAPPPLPTSQRTPFSLKSVNFRKAAGSSFVILLLGWFFIQTQWPKGVMLGMVFSAIVIGLSAMFPLIMIHRQLLWSLIIGAGIAAPLYFLVMPGMNQYQELIPWLFVAFFPLLYMIDSKPQKMLQYLFSAIFVIALLLLHEEGQSYSFSSFVNTWLGFCGGFAGALAVLGLFSSVVPEREFRKQVCSFFSGCGESMQAHAKILPVTPGGVAVDKTDRQQWPDLFKQLQMWSSAIDYTRVPGCDRQSTQALIDSIQHAALCLDAAEHVRQQTVEVLDETLCKLLDRFYDTCVESFQLIANSLAELKPIPDLSETWGLVREIDFRSDDLRRSAGGNNGSLTSLQGVLRLTVHMNLLADELNNCREKVNALDGKGWNRNYL